MSVHTCTHTHTHIPAMQDEGTKGGLFCLSSDIFQLSKISIVSLEKKVKLESFGCESNCPNIV